MLLSEINVEFVSKYLPVVLDLSKIRHLHHAIKRVRTLESNSATISDDSVKNYYKDQS